jgi:predicted transposase YdaD
VIIYPHREIENSPKSRYQEFFESGRVNCYYLNQLDEGDSLGVKVLQLIVESEPNTLAQGKELIQQVRQQFQESLKREDILELIETILIYKLPKLNRKEIEKMFSLSDLRETKVYQEALEEGELSAKKSLILRQLNLKLGSIPLKVEQKIKQLNPNQLDNLALALLDFSDVEDLHQWLN